MKKSKIVLVSFFVGLIATFLILRYAYQDHRNIADEKAEFQVKSKALVLEFSENLETATTKYLDRIVQVDGLVSEVDGESFVLDEYIICYSDSITLSTVKKNQNVSVKGRLIGYDELLENVKLDQVLLLK